MQRLFAKLFLVVAVVLFLATRPASAMPEIFPLDELKSGMKGKAYTVVDGSGKIENFDVDIVGVTDDGKGSRRMIMARASGEVINRTGGVLQGMSGSPIYINGKLVGALAATLKEMDPYTFFITPIESMLELWTLPDPKAQVNQFRRVKDKSKPEKSDKPADNAKAPDDTKAQDKPDKPAKPAKPDKPAKPAKDKSDKPKTDKKSAAVTELGAYYLGGFNESGAEFLRRELGIINLNSTPAATDRNIAFDATLEPGSALGVAVICGDFSLGATGTVTAVDGKKILAFGHPFTHAGNVNYFMTEASVIGSVSGRSASGVKLAGIGHIIGRINQDRDSGVAGVLGSFPAVVPITVTVKDNALGKQETFHAKIAYNETLLPKLGASVAYTALSKMADSLAESTVEIEFSVKTDSIPDGEIVRKNMFYNPSDVGQVAVIELMQAINLVCSNTREESNIFGINVNISFDADRRTASIVSITPEKKSVKPGETVNLTVELQPYRKPVEKVILPYTIPLTARPGNFSLEVHGGALVPVNQANSGLVTADSNKSYEEKINAFLKTGKSNQLVVEIGSSGELKSDKQLRKEIAQAKRAQARLKKLGMPVKKADSKVDTNYIIDNVMRTTLNVEKV